MENGGCIFYTCRCLEMRDIMNTYEIIAKKRDKNILEKDEIEYMVNGFTKGNIPDYQMSAFLMAIYLNGMTDEETLILTQAMMHSGKVADLSEIQGIKVDKHSTGGVADTTTLVVAPIVASCGVPVVKMSGRGLGHTGGTIDKLESIPGFQTKQTMKAVFDQVNEIGVAISAQTQDLAPADKKIYALRDVTATVESIPLIASSIMSKKLAAGADAIVLDVKVGSGAFMKTKKDAYRLAKEMVKIGNGAGKHTVALLTDMSEPLGDFIGNALEVQEAVLILKGLRKGKLYDVCIELAAHMLLLAGKEHDLERARESALDAIHNGAALRKFMQLVKAQGGNTAFVDDFKTLPSAKYKKAVCSPKSGYVSEIMCEELGRICVHLGGGREIENGEIDLSVGMEIKKRIGDFVKEGEEIAVIHANDRGKLKEAKADLLHAYQIVEEPVERKKAIMDYIYEESVNSLP